VKLFHTLLYRYRVTESEKTALLMQYNQTSSVYLSVRELSELCRNIERAHGGKQAKNGQTAEEMDKWRKRLMGAIGGWLRAMNIRPKNEAEYIKNIACRAAGRDSFNAIPKEQLRGLYNGFLKKKKDLKTTEELTAEKIEILSLMN
jgi:hypothetical protein